MSSIRMMSGAPSRGPADSPGLATSHGINTSRSVLLLLNEDANIITLPCALLPPIRHEHRRLERRCICRKAARPWSRDLDVTSDEGLVGSEWMGQLWLLLSWRIWSCGKAYSVSCEDDRQSQGERFRAVTVAACHCSKNVKFLFVGVLTGRLSISACFKVDAYHSPYNA
ncbi:hypothetical protein V8C26DRAFT_253049 [Trichoderma gracile]